MAANIGIAPGESATSLVHGRRATHWQLIAGQLQEPSLNSGEEWLHVLPAPCLLIHSLSLRTPFDAVQRGADSSSSVALQGSVVSLDDELGCPGSPWESSFISSLLITFLLYNM